MPAAAAAALCSRVTTTSVIIRASPPLVRVADRAARRRRRSPTSAVGTARVPSLSLSRCRRPRRRRVRRGGEPGSGESAAYRGTRNGARPGCRGRRPRAGPARPPSPSRSAEQNHFSPVSRHEPSAAGRPVVVARPTSEPPCDSVIHWPLVIAVAGSVEMQPGQPGVAHAPGPHRSGTAARRRRRPSRPGRRTSPTPGPYRCSRACWTTRAPAPHVRGPRPGTAGRPRRARRRRRAGRSQPAADLDPVDPGAPRVVAVSAGGCASASACAARSGPMTSAASAASGPSAAAWPSAPSSRSQPRPQHRVAGVRVGQGRAGLHERVIPRRSTVRVQCRLARGRRAAASGRRRRAEVAGRGGGGGTAPGSARPRRRARQRRCRR